MFKYKNFKIETSTAVYEPAEDSTLAAGLVESYLGDVVYKGLKVLDLGTGTGILGLVAASNEKVREVTFADINKEAVQLAERNVNNNRNTVVARCSYAESNLLSHLQSQYDLIIFNPPYLRHRSDNETLKAAFDGGNEGVEVSIEFLKQAAASLSQSGAIVLVHSSLSNTKKLEDEIRREGFRVLRSEKVHFFFEDIVASLITR